MFRYFKKEIYTYCIMETKKKLTKNQLDALARGRAIRKQNIKTLSKNQTGGTLDYFNYILDNFWINADLRNPGSKYHPDTYRTSDWDFMIDSGSGFEESEGDGDRAAGRRRFNIFCPQPWGFILAAYKFLTADIMYTEFVGATVPDFDGGDWRNAVEDIDHCNPADAEYEHIIDEKINIFLDDDTLTHGRGYRNDPGVDAWGRERDLGPVNMYDYFADNLSIDRTKVKHFLFKTIKVILEKRCEHLNQDRYGPDQYRVEMPMFSDLVDQARGNNSNGVLTADLQYIWGVLLELTQWSTESQHIPRPQDARGAARAQRAESASEVISDMIDMFEEIWKRLIVPSMKTVVETADDPYEEFGIPAAHVVPVSEDTPQMAFQKLPIELIAEHERKILDKKYLDKWGPYGIKSVDKKTRESLDHWQKSYSDSYHKGIAPPGIWTEPPEPKAVTRIKKSRERDAMRALKKRSGAAAGGESDYYSDTSSSDDDE